MAQMNNDIYNKPNLADGGAPPQREWQPPKNAANSKALSKKLKKHEETIKNFKIEGISPEAPINMDRGMTDVCWLFIFMASMVAMLGVVGYGVSQGDFKKMAAPYDRHKRLCGFKNWNSPFDMTGYDVLYFHNLKGPTVEDILASGTCLKSCPTKDDLNQKWFTSNCKDMIIDEISQNECKIGDVAGLYESQRFGYICYPPPGSSSESDIVKSMDKMKTEFEGSKAGQELASIGKAIGPIIILLITGTLLAFSYIFAMSRCAKGMAYAAIGLLLIMLFGGGALLVLSGQKVGG